MARLRDACLFYGTFEGALKGLVIHVMATRHRSMDRSNACAAQNPEPRPGMPGADTSAQGRRKRNAAAALGWSFSHHARARQLLARRLGAKLSGNIKARSLEPLPPHDDRAVIEIRSLTRSCKPSLIRMPVPYRSWANKRARLPENRGCEPLHQGQHHRQAPRRPRSSDLRNQEPDPQHLAVEEQQGRQCLTMRGDRNLALVRQPELRNASTSLLPKVAG